MENFKEELNQIRSLFNELQKQDLGKLKLLKNNSENEKISKDENQGIKKPDYGDFEDYEQ